MAGIINRSYYAASEQGRQDAQAAQVNALRAQAMRNDLEQENVLRGLMQNPQATPEQFARAGRSDIANVLVGRQSADQEAQAAQVKQFANQMFTATKYVNGIQAGQKKAFIERNFPMLAQEYGPEWATASEDQIQAHMQDVAAKFGTMLGQSPEQPKQPSLITAMGPDGKPVRVADAPGVIPYVKPSSGISFTSPDGTTVQIGGDGTPNYGGVGLTKPNETKLQEAFINAQGNAYALTEQLSKYRDEFSTLGGRAKAAIAGAKEYVGIENAPQQQQFLNDFTSWKSDTSALLSQYLNQLSGAAISPSEEARLKAGFPNADDPPTVYKSKADATLRRFALVQARAAYLLSTGNNKLDSVSLEGMQNIVLTEANKLAKSYERAGMNEEQAKARAISETKQRFGMGQ